MFRVDASVVLNLHNEGALLIPTLLSLDRAANLFTQANYSIELVIVLDNADALTTKLAQEYTDSNFSFVKVIFASNGSLGLSRNSGIMVCEGEYIFTADGDDLISDNFFLASFEYRKRFSKYTLFFPEALVGFGDNYYISLYQNLKEITPFSFLEYHPYTSRVFAHTDVFKGLQYIDVRLSRGYAFEDWHFNCEAVSAGIDIQVVPDTILFYRQREGSLLREANSLSSRQIPPSSLFYPTNFLAVCKEYGKKSKPINRVDELKKKYDIKDLKSYFYQQVVSFGKIEALIEQGKFKSCPAFSNAALSPLIGEVYCRICEIIEDGNYQEVFLLPFVYNGGAEKYINEVISSIYRQWPERNILVILGEDGNSFSNRDKFPPNVTCLDLSIIANELSTKQRLLLTVKILQLLKDGARVHIRQSVFGAGFIEHYSNLFSNLIITLYRFCDSKGVGAEGELVTTYSPIEMISKNLSNIDLIVTDNMSVLYEDQNKLSGVEDKWSCLYAPIVVTDLIVPTQQSSRKLLWASRLDDQKRIQLLPKIGCLVDDLGYSIDIYGEVVLGGTSTDYLECPTITYCGKFNCINDIKINNYEYFIYTSYYDGLPNILLEVMAAGLVVIAPNVGGVSEVIQHLHTGYLIDSVADDDAMARQYYNAVKYLSERPEIVIKIIGNAKKLLIQRHSLDAYDERLKQIFGYNVASIYNEASTERELLTDQLLHQRFIKTRNSMDKEMKRLQERIHQLTHDQRTLNSKLKLSIAQQEHFNKYKSVMDREVEILQEKIIDLPQPHQVSVSAWPLDSRAHRVANIYTQTAHGPNFIVKFWKFSVALTLLAVKKIKRNLRR